MNDYQGKWNLNVFLLRRNLLMNAVEKATLKSIELGKSDNE